MLRLLMVFVAVGAVGYGLFIVVAERHPAGYSVVERTEAGIERGVDKVEATVKEHTNK